jgi:hypothetical protein
LLQTQYQIQEIKDNKDLQKVAVKAAALAQIADRIDKESID